MSNDTSVLKFVIGVTGHRDCAEMSLPLVEKILIVQLQNIRSIFTHTPIELVCGLAEGADTFAAEAALGLGMKVQAVLPMPLENYKEDFSESGLKALEKIIAHPDVSLVEIPLAQNGEIDRDIQYLLLKDYIIRRSNVLIALWDAKVTGLSGGTSDVVLNYLAEDSAGKYTLSDKELSRTSRLATKDDDGNVVISIHTPRIWTQDSDEMVGVEYLVSEGSPSAIASLIEFPDKIVERWKGLDDYSRDRNSDIGTELHSYDLMVENPTEVRTDLNTINQEFIRADQLAMANQKSSDRMFKGFGLAAGAMGLFFLIYAKLSSEKIYLIAYLALFAGGYFFFKLGQLKGWFGKHLVYRALAETIRVKYYLILSGCSGSVHSGRILKSMRVNRFRGIEWLSDAIKCAEPLVSLHNSPEGLEQIRTQWIDDQSKYFSKKVHSLHQEHEKLEHLKKALFAGSFFGALALLFFKSELYYLHIFETDGKTLLVFFMGLLPLWLALWELYQGKMAIRELGWQYSNQQQIFSEASRRMADNPLTPDRQAIVQGLAESSLTEIFMWTVQRFHRDHEPPTAG